MTRALVALAICLALAVLHTWPLARDVERQSRHDNADTTLNTWAVAWIAHALPRTPLDVFDAPMFHPERRTLAYSEPLLVPGVMAIPLRVAGLSVTATYNGLVILGFALSAWAMWRLVAAWTGDEWAGAVAGAAFAFNAHVLTRFAHLQAIHAEALPLVLLGIDRVARLGRARDGVLLGIGVALTGLTSIYQLVFAAAAVVAGLLARTPEWRGRWKFTLRSLLGAVATAALVLAPVLWQYLAVNREWGLARTLDDSASYAATWRDYLATGGRLHLSLWSARFSPTATALFPGVTVTALALVGLVHARTTPSRVAMSVAIGLTGLVLSFGPATPIYRLLFDVVPLLQATRVSARWGWLLLVALAVLAGYGVAGLRGARPKSGPSRAGDSPHSGSGLNGGRRQFAGPSRSDRARTVIGAAALALVTLEAIRTPMAFTATPAIAPFYRQLAAIPNAVLLEFPTYPRAQANLNAPYLLAQTTHWHPIVAGYSGFSTRGFDERLADLTTFPSEVARRRIEALGITHVVLHLAPLRAAVGQGAIDAVDDVPWLERVLGDGDARVFRVRREGPTAR